MNVENNVTEPSSLPLARTFPSGENSRAEIDPFRPVIVVSGPYGCADMGVEDEEVLPRGGPHVVPAAMYLSVFTVFTHQEQVQTS